MHCLRRPPLLLVLLGILAAEVLPAQQVPPGVFRANARIVVLDVAVSGKNHRPLTGLHQQDFVLIEDGQAQTISNFEEHSGKTPASGTAVGTLEATPDVYTNTPPLAPTDSVTVLVLDSLNTPIEDQANLRAQVTKYLKKQSSVPRRPIAIFTLTSRLIFVQGFTDDPAQLSAALNGRSHTVQESHLLVNSAEKAANQETVDALYEVHAVDAAKAMEQFIANQGVERSTARAQLTLAALQQLARYLAGFPGRKNVVWFSGSFPVVLFPNLKVRDPFQAQSDNQALLHKTDALLAAAQMAIYPVSAEGVATDSFSAAEDARLVTRSQLTQPGDEGVAKRGADQSTMDLIAQDTGGFAQYGTNSLGEALDRAAVHGSNFYTLTYTSTNHATDGRFRKVEVRLASAPGYQLAYRRGYYADNPLAAPANPNSDLLSPYLRPGLPDSTQVPFTLHLTHSAPAGLTPAGDNPNLKGPLTRYKVDFLIPARSLQYEVNAAGVHLVHVESGLVIYNAKGEPLNYILRRVNLSLDADRYAKAQTAGVNLYFEIDAPQTASSLRGGIYDLNAQLSGTLQIPLLTASRPEVPVKR
jgi:VWFA-related protein